MSLSELQQANSILGRASSVLLVVPEKPSLDALASMIALYCALQDSHSKVDQVSANHVPATLQFLSGSSQVHTEPTSQPQIVLDLAGPSNIESVRTEQLQGGMRVHISLPGATPITKDNIETTVRTLPYDAVICLGATDLEELGLLFTTNADFFYNTPLVNIDHRAANEHFGTVNLVDITAGSSAEVAYELVSSRTQGPLDPDIATALYAGIIAGTDSFQKPSTTPRSFQIAAHLIEQKANREAVIQHLVKTKPLNLIKLVGLLYAHLHHEEGAQLYWTTLNKQDFSTSEASPDDISTAMHELTNNIAGFNVAFLLYEDPTPQDKHLSRWNVYLLLGSGLKSHRREIQETLTATSQNGSLTFTIPAPTLEEAEKTAHQKIKQILP